MVKTHTDISPAKMYLIEKFERKYGTTVLRIIQLIVLIFAIVVIASLYIEYESLKSGETNPGNGMYININNTSGSTENTQFEESNSNQIPSSLEKSGTRIETKTIINGKTVEHTIVE